MGTSAMKNDKGFTLLELLFVLLVLSVVSVIVLPSLFQTLAKQEAKHFFQLFESDAFLTQNKSLYTPTNDRILMDRHHYVISGDGKVLIRNYPNDLDLTSEKIRIRFSLSGTIVEPTTYRFISQSGIYKVIFPFGKGRFYLEES